MQSKSSNDNSSAYRGELLTTLSGGFFGEAFHVAVAMIVLSPCGRLYLYSSSKNTEKQVLKKTQQPSDEKKRIPDTEQVNFLNNISIFLWGNGAGNLSKNMLIKTEKKENQRPLALTDLTENVISPAYEKDGKKIANNVRNAFLHIFTEGAQKDKIIIKKEIKEYLIKYLGNYINTKDYIKTPKIIIRIRYKEDKNDLNPNTLIEIFRCLDQFEEEIGIVLMGDHFAEEKPKLSIDKVINNYGRGYKRSQMVTIFDLRLKDKTIEKDLVEKFPQECKEVKPNTYAIHLLLMDILATEFNVKCAIGMRSGALDGAAFMGMHTIFFDDKNRPSKRMLKVTQAIPWIKSILLDDQAQLKQKQELETFLKQELETFFPSLNQRKFCKEEAKGMSLTLFPYESFGFSIPLSNEPVLLNGMKVIFDQPVGVYPVTLESKLEERRNATSY